MHDALIVSFFWPDVYLYKQLQYPSAKTILPCVATAMICHHMSGKSRLLAVKLEANPQPCVRYHAKLLHWEKL